MWKSTQHKRSPRKFLWVVLFVGGFALAGCGSETSDNGTNDNGAAASVDAGDASDALADAQAQLEALQESGSLGSGSGSITIEGVDYSFEAKVCYSHDSGFEATGPGLTAEGVPYWASLSTAVTTRESMEETGLPQANIDAFFGDKDSIEGFTLEIELGKADQFSPGDDSLAEFRIDAFDITNSDDLSYTVAGTTLSGTGAVTDGNGVVMAYTETAPVTFTASCG